MEKIKIAVWGISDSILVNMKEMLSCKNADIAAFFDSDELKADKKYMGIGVSKPTREAVLNAGADYILVTPFSAYRQIKDTLISYGIDAPKIQPFITSVLTEYFIGGTDDIDTEFINRVYVNPSAVMNVLAQYNRLCELYMQPPAVNDFGDEWYKKGTLISHALGGVVNGERLMYSNSVEAFLYSAEHGFKLMECDIMRNENGTIVCAHDMGAYWDIEKKLYTQMTFYNLLLHLKKYPDISCLIDVKWDVAEEYKGYVKEIDGMLRTVSADESEYIALKNQIVMEVYNEETIQVSHKARFNMTLTSYRRDNVRCHMNTAHLCNKYGIKAALLAVDDIELFERKRLKTITDTGIRVFVYSTDSIDDYKYLLQNGVTGILTNYLTYDDIKNI